MNKDQFDILPKIVSKLSDSIFYITHSGTSGYANAANGYMYDILQKNISLTVSKITFDTGTVNNTSKIDEMIDVNMVKKPYNTVVVHTTPDMWESIINTHNIPASKTIIGRTVWEFDKLIPNWVDAINNSRVNIVSVPSQWNKDVFINSGVKKPIVVEPHVYIDLPFDSVSLESLIKTCEIIYDDDFNKFDLNKAYKFYTIGQFIPRKGISETIELFCSTFTKNDKVILFLKTFGKDYSENSINECRNKIEQLIQKYTGPNGHAPIIFIKSELTDVQIQSLHKHCDCYVQLTRAEGFGLGIFDAYKSGNQVITTKYGVPIDYLGSDYSGLVDCTLVPVTDAIFFQFNLDETYNWAKPSISHAQQLVKKLISTSKILVRGDVDSKIVQTSTNTCDTQVIVVGSLYNIEKFNVNEYVKWFGKQFTFYFSNAIKKIRIHYKNINKDRIINVDNYVFKNLEKSGFFEQTFEKNTNKICFELPTYTLESDIRDLGILISCIEYTDTNDQHYYYPIDKISSIPSKFVKFLGYKTASNNTYYHCGDFGDIIYALPVIKHTGGGILYLGNDLRIKDNRCKPRDMINESKCEFLKTLLESQCYIKEVIFTDKYPEGVTYDLNKFRKFFVNKKSEYNDFPGGTNISILDSPLLTFNIDLRFCKNKGVSK